MCIAVLCRLGFRCPGLRCSVEEEEGDTVCAVMDSRFKRHGLCRDGLKV